MRRTISLHCNEPELVVSDVVFGFCSLFNRMMLKLLSFYFELVVDIVIGARGLWFDSSSGQIRRSVATAAMFRRSCVAQALNCGDGSCHSLHASA